YNGLKFCLAGAKPVGEGSGLEEIRALVEKGDQILGADRGRVTQRDLLDVYVDHVLGFADVQRMRPLTVAVDTANGMGGLVVPAVMARLPVTLHHLYAELDGTFPNHPADPIDPENQRDLKAAVGRHGADVGMAFDGDADRVFLVDERAEDVSGSTMTALIAAAMLDREPGAKVVHNLICSRAVPEVIREHGGVPVRTRVGHSYIKQVMAETRAIFGGEHSGHYYFRDNYGADSGLIAAVIALGELSTSDRPLSELLRPYARYPASGEINTTVDDPATTIERVADRFGDGRQDRLDGLTVEFDEWWCNVRASNTEPLLRLNVEAASRELLVAKTEEVLAVIRGEGGTS
ncbi:MAG TPA: phosphomannomutase/phosphoglucomutase, partial [Actinomycetota bacterium]